MANFKEEQPVEIKISESQSFSPEFYLGNASGITVSLLVENADMANFEIQLKSNSVSPWGTWLSTHNEFLNPAPDGLMKSIEKNVAPGQLTNGDSVQFSLDGLEDFSQVRFGLTASGEGLATLSVSMVVLG